MQLLESALKGCAIDATDGKIGTVSDFLFDDRTWKIRWLVVDTGNWLPGRKVLLHPSAIGNVDLDTRTIPVALTRDQIKTSPEISVDQPVSMQMQSNLYDYYGWDPYWGNGFFGMNTLAAPIGVPLHESGPAPHALELETPMGDGDPNLRSVTSIAGYHLHATDGNLGHVSDFLLDNASWEIRYLIGDTRNWWPGKHVLLSPVAVTQISWANRLIHLNLPKHQIQASPEWDPVTPLDEAYQQRLHSYYDWPGYGW